jgi:hypothetical protein
MDMLEMCQNVLVSLIVPVMNEARPTNSQYNSLLVLDRKTRGFFSMSKSGSKMSSLYSSSWAIRGLSAGQPDGQKVGTRILPSLLHCYLVAEGI